MWWVQFCQYFQNKILTQITSDQLECIRYIFKENMFYMEHKIGVGFFQMGAKWDWEIGEQRSVFEEAEQHVPN